MMKMENDGGYLVPDEYVIPLWFAFKYPSKRIQERKDGNGIWAWLLRLIGNENGYVWIETQDYLKFKAEWEREHRKTQDYSNLNNPIGHEEWRRGNEEWLT